MDPRQWQGRTVIRAGRVIDPSQSIDRVDDVTIVDGRIESVGPADERPDRTIDADGLIVCPGLIDMHVHLREPGGEEQETIETGTRAAAAGGFTAVACMPNTKPPIDDVGTLRFVLDKARSGAHCRVYPVAAMTVGQRGEAPVDMPALKAAGAIAFSDDGFGVDDDRVARAVFDKARPCDALLIQHCEVAALSAGGCVNLGRVSQQLGLAGIDPRAETEMLARDLDLLRGSPVRYHAAHVSTAGAVDLVRRGKAEGLPVTAEVTVHHLALTEDAVLRQGANAKMNPPLRAEADVAACRQGLCDGTIDCIVTDHAPHTKEAKRQGLRHAPFGVVGLETAWPVSWGILVETGRLDPAGLIDRMSCRPARILGLPDRGTLAPGTVADVTMLDAAESWVLNASSLTSKSSNSPFIGWRLVGRCVATLVAGVCQYALDGSEGRFTQTG